MNQRQIKVLSLATTYSADPKVAKAQFVHVLNKELIKHGVSVTALSPHSKGIPLNEIQDNVLLKRFRYLPESYESSKLSIPDEIKSKRGFAKVFIMIATFFVSTFFTCLKNKPDIIHGQWAFPGGYIAYMMSKIFSAKAITTVHHAEIPLLLRFKLLRRMVVHGLNNSSKVVAVSNYTKNQLISMGVKEEQITIIKPAPNFVEHTSDIEFLDKFRSKFALSNEKIILYCGRLVEHKGVDYLIRSIPEIKTNIHLIIVGEGFLDEQLKELAESLNLKNKVTFFGSASHEELGWLHDISDVFACPSIIDSQGHTEGLGLVIPEAMESKLPIVASSVGGIVDIVKNEVNGLLIPPKDPDSISKAIQRIILDEKFARTIIENSQKTVHEFSTIKIAQEYLDLFKVVCSAKIMT